MVSLSDALETFNLSNIAELDDPSHDNPWLTKEAAQKVEDIFSRMGTVTHQWKTRTDYVVKNKK